MSYIRTHEEAKAQGLMHLTPEEVRSHVYNLLDKSSRWDTWALKYGPAVASVMAAVPGVVMVHNIRAMHRMHNITSGRMVTIIPAVVTPCLASYISQFINADRVMMGKAGCSVCHEVRSVSFQLATGIFMPIVISLGISHLNLRALSIKLPNVNSMEMVKWCRRIMQRNSFMLGANLCLQTAVMSFLAYKQTDQWYHLEAKARENQRKEAESPQKPKSKMITAVNDGLFKISRG